MTAQLYSVGLEYVLCKRSDWVLSILMVDRCLVPGAAVGPLLDTNAREHWEGTLQDSRSAQVSIICSGSAGASGVGEGLHRPPKKTNAKSHFPRG